MKGPIFNEAQRARLEALKLTKEEIEKLDSVVPLCRSLLAERPKLNDVRKQLKEASDGLNKAFQALRGGDSASHEALSRLAVRVCAVLLNDEALAPTMVEPLPILKALADCAESAWCELKQEDQRRPHDAHPLPIAIIDTALGYRLPVSREGRFSSIVEICYEAIGREPPERAIRAYIENSQTTRPRPNIKVLAQVAGIVADGPFSLVRHKPKP